MQIYPKNLKKLGKWIEKKNLFYFHVESIAFKIKILIRVGLPPSNIKNYVICSNEIPLKMMKTAFHLKSSFCSQDT